MWTRAWENICPPTASACFVCRGVQVEIVKTSLYTNVCWGFFSLLFACSALKLHGKSIVDKRNNFMERWDLQSSIRRIPEALRDCELWLNTEIYISCGKGFFGKTNHTPFRKVVRAKGKNPKVRLPFQQTSCLLP